jgi:LTXXQ motif family protein
MTPVSRLQAMISRLQTTLDAIAIVQPALEKFYGALNDEQRARFDAMQAGVGEQPAQTTADEQANACSNASPDLLIYLSIELTKWCSLPTNKRRRSLA